MGAGAYGRDGLKEAHQEHAEPARNKKANGNAGHFRYGKEQHKEADARKDRPECGHLKEPQISHCEDEPYSHQCEIPQIYH